MKQLTIIFGALLLMALADSCRPNQKERYERYMEDVADSTFEFVTPKQDSLNADGEPVEKDADWANDDGLVAVPDIPQERSVDMGASDYELNKIMSGKDSE